MLSNVLVQPWPRSYYARLIKNLKDAGAKAVGIDIILRGNDAFSLENDEELRAAIKESGIVVLAGKTEVQNDLYVHTTLTENYGNMFFDVDSSLGIVNIRNDADGVYRRYSTSIFEVSDEASVIGSWPRPFFRK